MHRWVSMTQLHMHQGISCLKGKTDDGDILWCHHHTDYVIWQLYKKGSHTGPRVSLVQPVLVGFLARVATDPLFQISWCLTCSRTIKHTGKCLFFVYLIWMHPRFTWTPQVNLLKLLVCWSGGSPHCIHQTQYWKSKDHCHLEMNCTLGTRCSLGAPTEIFQYPHATFLASLGGLKKLHNPGGLVLTALGCGRLWLPLELLTWWFDKPGW